MFKTNFECFNLLLATVGMCLKIAGFPYSEIFFKLVLFLILSYLANLIRTIQEELKEVNNE